VKILAKKRAILKIENAQEKEGLDKKDLKCLNDKL